MLMSEEGLLGRANMKCESKHVPACVRKNKETSVVGLDNGEAGEMNSKIH